MSCESLFNLPKTVCGPMIHGGVTKLYAIRFEDLEEVFSSGKVYTLDEDGNIDFINTKPNTNFIEVGLLKFTTSLSEQLNRRISTGNAYFTQRIILTLSKLNTTNRNWIENTFQQRVCIVVVTTSGYHAAGLFEGLDITSIERTTGTNQNDFQGATITFSGIDTRMFYNVVPSVMIPSEYFNYMLEINSGNKTELESTLNFQTP